MKCSMTLKYKAIRDPPAKKLSILSEWEKRKLKTSTVQDGTNSVLIHTNETVEEMLQQHQDSIK